MVKFAGKKFPIYPPLELVKLIQRRRRLIELYKSAVKCVKRKENDNNAYKLQIRREELNAISKEIMDYLNKGG